MDDIIILCSSKEELHQLRQEIQEFLATELHLELKSNWQVFPTLVRGVDFLGYRVFKDFILLRQSIAKNFKKKMVAISDKVKEGKEIVYSDYCSANSYKGWLGKCNAWRLLHKYLHPLTNVLQQYSKERI